MTIGEKHPCMRLARREGSLVSPRESNIYTAQMGAFCCIFSPPFSHKVGSAGRNGVCQWSRIKVGNVKEMEKWKELVASVWEIPDLILYDSLSGISEMESLLFFKAFLRPRFINMRFLIYSAFRAALRRVQEILILIVVKSMRNSLLKRWTPQTQKPVMEVFSTEG